LEVSDHLHVPAALPPEKEPLRIGDLHVCRNNNSLHKTGIRKAGTGSMMVAEVKTAIPRRDNDTTTTTMKKKKKKKKKTVLPGINYLIGIFTL
jgi:hypothetical protein